MSRLKIYHMRSGNYILMFLSMATMLFAQPQMHNKGEHRRQIMHGPFWSELSDSQKDELKALIQTLRNENVTPDSLRTAIHEKLSSWNIELPDMPGFFNRFDDRLNADQKNEIHALIDSLNSQNASRKKIHLAIKEKLDSWGIKPKFRNFQRNFRKRRMFSNLTDEQQKIIQNLIKDMREKNATPQEVHQAVADQLKTWGIEPPQKPNPDQEQQNPEQKGNKVQGLNRPNPFNPSTTIIYELQQEATDVIVTIFNTQGQSVRIFSQGYQQTGEHQIQWDGKSESGESVPSGTYIYKIQAGDQNFQGRMVLMK